MGKLDKALLTLNSLGRGTDTRLSASALLVVTLVFLCAVLSVPLQAPQLLVWLIIYPAVQSEISGIGFSRIVLRSLWVLPLVLLIGIFNPILDTTPAFRIGEITITCGWVSFFSLSLRGILAVQAALILAFSVGFYNVCHSLRHFGCPKILLTQLQFTYRYLMVLIEEALWMDRARKARAFGSNSYPIKLWANFIGQLLVRSYDRASAVHRAMLARGFSGTLPSSRSHTMKIPDWIFMFSWSAVILCLRFCNISSVFSVLINH